MKKGANLLLGLAVGLAASPAQASNINAGPLNTPHTFYFTLTPQGGNSISGHVFGESRRPVADVYIELLDEVYTSIGRAKTNSTGFYTFGGLSQGTFKVRVMPYGTDYMEQTQEVTIQNISVVQGGGHDTAQLDFYLKLRENANSGPFAAPGAIFVQEVPAEAKKKYEEGIAFLRDKKEKEGFESLKRSIELFPTYYLALDRLGTEYVARGYYEAGYILLTKATEINSRGFSSVFGLGVAQYNLKRTDDAIVNLKNATTLYNKSVNAHLWLGIALKRASKLDQAEASFKRANELSKGKAPEVHWQMAKLYSEQNRYKEAADSLELFLKYQTDSQDSEKIKKLIQQLRAKAASK